MNALDVILAVLLAVAVFCAIRRCIRRGRHGCCSDCASCEKACGGCNENFRF